MSRTNSAELAKVDAAAAGVRKAFDGGTALSDFNYVAAFVLDALEAAGYRLVKARVKPVKQDTRSRAGCVLVHPANILPGATYRQGGLEFKVQANDSYGVNGDGRVLTVRTQGGDTVKANVNCNSPEVLVPVRVGQPCAFFCGDDKYDYRVDDISAAKVGGFPQSVWAGGSRFTWRADRAQYVLAGNANGALRIGW